VPGFLIIVNLAKSLRKLKVEDEHIEGLVVLVEDILKDINRTG
jgi:hypothetical protein